jgi:hypothetical protein
MAESRARAAANGANQRSWIAAVAIVYCWIALVLLTVWLIWR